MLNFVLYFCDVDLNLVEEKRYVEWFNELEIFDKLFGFKVFGWV